ncbi:MAG: PhzF family phenazine biosynthesis protein [Planctomycetota bacterium]|jgi:PhzF family phenazine biosynthesis protein
MDIPVYQVDAFTDRPLSGNPAAVCPLSDWLPDATMQAIAAENALSETAFLVRDGDTWNIRWFTPGIEVDLCGHATLASAFIVATELDPAVERIAFRSHLSGDLPVEKDGAHYVMDFPSRPAEPVDVPDGLVNALGAEPREVLGAFQYMAVFDDADIVRHMTPDMQYLMNIDRDGLIVTAPGGEGDFVSRFFVPAAGIPEDPVTGSTHCTLVPYWAERLGKTRLDARQLSERGGTLDCELRGDRVTIAGQAVLYMRGVITLPDVG